MKGILLLLAIALAGPAAYGNVAISNAYYTAGTEAYDDVSIKDVDYTNSIKIFDADLYSTSQTSLNEGAEEGQFQKRIVVSSGGVSAGAEVEVDAKEASCESTLAAGTKNGLQLSYHMGGGRAGASYFNGNTLVTEKLAANNNAYGSSFKFSENSFFFKGTGRPVGGNPGDFIYEIGLNRGCTGGEIASFLRSSSGGFKGPETLYSLSTYASGIGVATAGMRITAYQGKDIVDFGIKGTSTSLTNKYSPLEYAPEKGGRSAHLPALKPGGSQESKVAYMEYAID